MSEPTDSDDTLLVARCRAGDGAAWELLVRRYQRLVYAIVRRAGLDEHTAADVFQTVFLRLLQHLPRIAQPHRLHAWIVTTSKREAWLQRQRSMRLVSMAADGPDDESLGNEDDWSLVDEAPGPEETVAHWQQMAQVQVALQALDERCRQLLELLFGEGGVGYGEAARRLGVPVGSLGPTRARCLAKLRRSVG